MLIWLATDLQWLATDEEKHADDGILQLHSADDNAVIWPRDVAIRTLESKK